MASVAGEGAGAHAVGFAVLVLPAHAVILTVILAVI